MAVDEGEEVVLQVAVLLLGGDQPHTLFHQDPVDRLGLVQKGVQPQALLGQDLKIPGAQLLLQDLGGPGGVVYPQFQTVTAPLLRSAAEMVSSIRPRSMKA